MDWLSFLLFVFVASITPGPNNIMALTQASWVGFRLTFPFNCGVFFGLLAVSSICSFIAIFMRDFMPILMQALLYVGAAYILFLAYKTFTATGKINDERRTDNGAPIGLVLGALFQLVNPKAYVFSMLCLEGYILPAYGNDIRYLAIFSLTMGIFALICTVCWALFGATFRVLFTKYARITNTIMALLLVYCAVSLFV